MVELAQLIWSAHQSAIACSAFQARVSTDVLTETVTNPKASFQSVEAPVLHRLSAQPLEIALFACQALANTDVWTTF